MYLLYNLYDFCEIALHESFALIEHNFTIMTSFVKLSQCDFISINNQQIIYENETRDSSTYYIKLIMNK